MGIATGRQCCSRRSLRFFEGMPSCNFFSGFEGHGKADQSRNTTLSELAHPVFVPEVPLKSCVLDVCSIP